MKPLQLTRAEARRLQTVLRDMELDPGARVADVLTEADFVLLADIAERLQSIAHPKPKDKS